MTAGQLFVLALLLAAFGAGWYAGASRTRETSDTDLDGDLRVAGDALDRALRAYRSGTADALEPGLRELRSARETLARALSESNPLVDDLEQAAAALELLAEDDGDDSPELRAALERSAREARERFRRTSEAVVAATGRPA